MVLWDNVLELLLFKHLNTAESPAIPGLGKYVNSGLIEDVAQFFFPLN